jgi:hypothetical protein
MFKITQNRGIFITFSNNVTVSIQFGHNNYCANDGDREKMQKPDIDCEDSEVAVWYNPEGLQGQEGSRIFITKEYYKGYDDIEGWVSPDQIPDLMVWAKNYDVSKLSS